MSDLNTPDTKMPKKRIRKSPADIENAIREVLETGQSIRSVAKEYNIAKSALARLVKTAKNQDVPFTYKPNIGNRRIFSLDEENALAQYLKTASKMSYGLTKAQMCELAFEYAKKLGKAYNQTWDKNKTAGMKWYKSFMKRHTDLSLRKPEKTSLARATAFNKTVVQRFYTNLQSVLNKFKFTPENIFNADETSLLTVTELPNVLAAKGTKQVGQVCSQERGQLVTMLAFVSASGNTIPPAFVFPRVNFKSFMTEDCPVGSLGLANQSGWMTGDNFFLAFKHFVEYAKPTKGKPALLLFDNHDSHISLNVVSYAKDHNVVILTFPPHCSHRLQPLDISVFGPFKSFFRAALNDWMTSNPGRTATIYTLPKLAKIAFERAFTIKNIVAGFHKAGIHPFNSNIFSDEDFLSSYVSDRPFIQSEPDMSTPSTSTEGLSGKKDSTEFERRQVTPPKSSLVTPETIRPYPKAANRQVQKGGRKKGCSKVITETPEMNLIKEQHEEKQRKRQLTLSKVEKKIKKRILEDSSDSNNESEELHYDDSEESDDFEFMQEEKENELGEIKENDFVLIKFKTKEKNTFRHAVGQIIKEVENGEFRINFLKKSSKTDNFKFPEDEDIADVNRQDIVNKLPKPFCAGGTKRVRGFFTFGIDLSHVSGLM